ncbi:hypothetical protein [Bradyrhizobium sp. HKCCYLRH3083]|uniref:hypothetical protein n=1 Tax=unclassified Bradyrhizobium TaxID=2631580 RepID=UPI003EBCA20A
MSEEKPSPEAANAATQPSTEASRFIQSIIDARGITILSYAQVEWYLAKLILEGKEYDQYKQIDLSFSQDAKTRADKIKAMLKVDGGPLSPYADKLTKAIDDVLAYEELRNYAAHGLLVRPDPNDYSLNSKIHLRRFKMFKGGKLDDASRTLTLKEYTDEQVALTKAAKSFFSIVQIIWKDLGLKNLDE